ncbi:hypothetical protein NKR19_g3075 [Coniochaeta hoffmannii]|uniref:Uncharacterized protein n=1 Tax=Coniochaeta hoffmannii TaxID=91930 RepID=A0AA38S9D2_9PEZI|nr:hypothetical protein NKR19_g3075 [Coniochaeta hoffmannii]
MRPYAAIAAILLQGHRCFSLAFRSSTPETINPSSPYSQRICTQHSETPSWSVLNLTYKRINFGPPCVSPSGSCAPPFGGQPQALYYGELKLDILNKVTNQSHHCDVSSLSQSDLSTGSEEWLPCIEGTIFIMVPGYVTDTMFKLNHTSNSLELNQTWTCQDQGKNFTAYGLVSPVLDTSAKYVGNRDLGQIQIQGASPNIEVEGKLVNRS